MEEIYNKRDNNGVRDVCNSAGGADDKLKRERKMKRHQDEKYNMKREKGETLSK